MITIVNNNRSGSLDDSAATGSSSSTKRRRIDSVVEQDIKSSSHHYNHKSSKLRRHDDHSRSRSRSRRRSKSKDIVGIKRKHRESEQHDDNYSLRNSRRSKSKERRHRESESELNSYINRESTKRKHKESEHDESMSSSYHIKESLLSTETYLSSINRTYDQFKYDFNYKTQSSYLQRYSRYTSKYQNYRKSFRCYPQQQHSNGYRQYSTIDCDRQQYDVLTNGTVTFACNETDEFDDSPASGEIELDDQKRINSKIIDALDIDWSIISSSKYFCKNSQSDFLSTLKPWYILSTIGVLNEYLDEKKADKIKDYVNKEQQKHDINQNETKIDTNSYIKDLNAVKNQIATKAIKLNSSGICIRNDIERRKKLYFHQVNNHIHSSIDNHHQNDEYVDFYHQAIDLLKDLD